MPTRRKTEESRGSNGPIEVAIDFPDPAGHRIGVEVRFVAPVDGPEIAFATWTPGSYLIREFARQVEDFEARGTTGRKRKGWTKSAKNRWRIDARAGEGVEVRYRVYSRELSVRTPFVDDVRAFLSPTGLVPFVVGLESAPIRVKVVPPKGWRVDCALPEERGSGGTVRLASDFDHLADSPFEVGTHTRHDFKVAGRMHRMTFTGAGNEDRSRCVRDFEAIVRQGEELFGSLPYDSYLMVIHLLASSRGGLEHRDSAICDYPRLGFSGNDYEEFVGLVCHEYFHTWNVKRIKPAAFLPYDYEKECYTRLLWAMEGTTSYYEWLLLRRAGLLSAERYLARLADKINRLEEQPGRLRKPLADASFDTWIKAYRPDEHSANSTISYYEKGELVALLLDLEIRKGTGGSRSYDDLMRLLHERYGSRGVGIPEDGYRPAAEEIAGRPLAEFWRHYIEGTDEIDWASALAQAGLAVAQVDANPKVGWIGVRTKSDGGRLLLETVLDGGPAHRAGLAAGDEVVALDRFRVDPDSFARRIEQLGGGSRTEVTFFREGVQKSVRLGVGARPRKIGKIAFDPTAPEKARAATRDWLRGPEERKARR